MIRYIALFHTSPDGGWGVMFPDFPGCISAGDTYEEAMKSGMEALSGHVALMRADGDPIPTPRSLESIRAEAEDWIEWDGAITGLVPLLPPSGTVRLNISMDQRLLTRIDAAAHERAMTRSTFLAEAAQRAMDESRAN
jgi:predicted RNase H-like HicB family nuclease